MDLDEPVIDIDELVLNISNRKVLRNGDQLITVRHEILIVDDLIEYINSVINKELSDDEKDVLFETVKNVSLDVKGSYAKFLKIENEKALKVYIEKNLNKFLRFLRNILYKLKKQYLKQIEELNFEIDRTFVPKKLIGKKPHCMYGFYYYLNMTT